MSAIETIFDLAREAIEKREAHDDDCALLWDAVQRARKEISAAPDQKLTRPIVRPADLSITKAAVDLVEKSPGVEQVVATYDANDKAYHHRVKWTRLGYQARTQKVSPGEYSVFVKWSPK